MFGNKWWMFKLVQYAILIAVAQGVLWFLGTSADFFGTGIAVLYLLILTSILPLVVILVPVNMPLRIVAALVAALFVYYWLVEAPLVSLGLGPTGAIMLFLLALLTEAYGWRWMEK